MATLALTALTSTATSGAFAAGGWAASGVGGFLISAAAAAIDARLIYPTLFKQDPQEGARINGLDFQKTDQGAPANRLFGGQVRTAGTLIWAGPLEQFEDRSGGGKGPGAGGNFIIYKYKNSVAVEIARCKRGKSIKKVAKVFADGKQFFNESGVQSNLNNTHISAEIITYFDNDFGGFGDTDGDPANPKFRFRMRLVSDEQAGGPNLGIVFQSGRPITVSGFTNNTAMSGLTIALSTVGGANGVGQNTVRIKSTTSGTLYETSFITIGGVTGTYAVTSKTTFAGTVGTPDEKVVGIVRVYQSGEAFSATGEFGLASAAGTNQVVTHTVSPGASTYNNGTFMVSATGRLSGTKSYLILDFFDSSPSDDPAWFFQGKDAGDPITLIQEDTTFSRTQAADVRFYLGTRTQPQDPTIVSVQGDDAPAYRGRAYMVIEDLELTDFGNRIPNFEFLVEVDNDDSLGTAITEMFADCGITAAGFDTTGITDLKLGGFTIRGPTQYKTAFQPIMIANHLISQQNGTSVKFIKRVNTELLDITGKTAAFTAGDTPAERPASFTELNEDDAVQNTAVKFFNPDDNLQVATEEAQFVDSTNAQVGVFESNMTMTKDEAKKLADTLFETSRIANKRTIKFTLPPSYLGIIKEGMRVQLTHFGQTRQYLVTRVDEGNNFLIECEAYQEDLEAFTQTVVAD